MMDALRRSVGGWVAKLFIGLLVLSFAVWGIADIFRGYRGEEVARVGETEITVESFRNALQREIQQISQQIGTYLTLDQARAAGLDRQVLGRLMAEAALNEEARRRGLGISDEVVAQTIRSDPTFQAPGGQFDRAYFDQVLRATGYSEALYVAQQRQELLRQSIAEAVAGGMSAPDPIAEAFHRYQTEERSAEYVLVTPDQIGEIPAPNEEQLRAYFEEHSSEFQAPEYRTVALMELQPEDIADEIEVTEEDARASFEARAGQFSRPERRTIEQIPFPSLEAATEAYQAIQAGSTFEEVAGQQGVAEADRVLGTLAREQVIDQQVAEAAFALGEGEVSQPIEGRFSPVLVRVTEIQEGETREFEEVADQVRRELALDRARTELLDLYDLVEDDRAAGLTLEEIAERRDLPFRVVDIDRQGSGPDGRPVDLPDDAGLVQEAFRTEPGIETDALQLGADGYLWFDVRNVTPSRERSFEEAREDVRAAWLQEQTRQAVEERASEIADRLRGGTAFSEVAGETGTASGEVEGLTRGGTEGPFGEAATGLLFTTPEGEIAVAQAADPSNRVVFRVSDVTVPAYTQSEAGPYSEQIVAGLADDVLNQYLVDLQDRLGVEINQQALAQAFGEVDSQ